MPTVGVYVEDLQRSMNNPNLSKDDFEDICWQYGLELDEETSEKQMVMKERGEAAAKECDERLIWKVDIPANRYDLLCVEGLTRALQCFKEVIPPPVFKLTKPQTPDGKPLQMHVKKEVTKVRPFVVSAVLRNVKFNKASYDSFIDLQDKLHLNICRKRTLVAIGTHDLDTVKGPFTYEAKPGKDIKFVPLTEGEGKLGATGKEWDAKSLLDSYSTHQQMKQYVPIIKDSPVYPVIYDATGKVLSLPPIINGHHSRITLDTKNVLIECTAMDHTKANIVLNQVVAMFSEYCSDKFTVEPVEVVYGKDYDFQNPFVKAGETKTYPSIDTRPMPADAERMKNALGLPKMSVDDHKMS